MEARLCAINPHSEQNGTTGEGGSCKPDWAPCKLVSNRAAKLAGNLPEKCTIG